MFLFLYDLAWHRASCPNLEQGSGERMASCRTAFLGQEDIFFYDSTVPTRVARALWTAPWGGKRREHPWEIVGRSLFPSGVPLSGGIRLSVSVRCAELRVVFPHSSDPRNPLAARTSVRRGSQGVLLSPASP